MTKHSARSNALMNPGNGAAVPRSAKFSETQRQRALYVIARCDGNISVAAKRLGISIATLSRWRRQEVEAAG
jgi:transposase-like protein